MLRQFLMGGTISVCNIVIHALVMMAVVRASQVAAVKVAARPNLVLIAVMVATVSVLMAAMLARCSCGPSLMVSSTQYRPALIFYTSPS